MIQIRKGQAPAQLARAEFSVRFRASFIDPEFRSEDPSIARLEEIAWRAYVDGRKAPFTQRFQTDFTRRDHGRRPSCLGLFDSDGSPSRRSRMPACATISTSELAMAA